MALILCGIPLVLLTAPPPVDFVELCLRRDAYREALGQTQLQPSPVQIVRTRDGRMLARPKGDFTALEPDRVGLVQKIPRVYGLRLTQPEGEVWVQAALPKGFYQMSGSLSARFRVILGFLLFYLLLLVSSSLWVRRLNGRLDQLRDLARRLAAGDLQASMPGQKGDSAEFDRLRRRLLAMAETIARRRQEELDQRQQFESASAERNRRLAEVSHDLRTPLTSILGYAQLYRDEGQPPLQAIETQGRALLLRIGQWLESCRLESAVLDVRRVSCDLHDLLEEGFHLAQQRQPLQARVELPEKSPIIQADTFLFPRVLCNLILALGSAELSFRVQPDHLQLSALLPRQNAEDEPLLSLESCSQLLALQAIRLEPSDDGFRLSWEATCQA
ncbi:hypothetical protein JST97_22885 [bacterium]|nr:hypothetical protein [bacterium]